VDDGIDVKKLGRRNSCSAMAFLPFIVVIGSIKKFGAKLILQSFIIVEGEEEIVRRSIWTKSLRRTDATHCFSGC
jgi:hypothetical protein